MEPSNYQFLQSVELRTDIPHNKNSFPFNIPALKGFNNLQFHPAVTFFVGENGSGKSTLLEAIAIKMGFGSEGGTRNVRVATADTVSNLHDFIRISRGVRKPTDGYFLRAESFYNIATFMDSVGYLESYGGKSLHAQSHGESFLALLTRKFAGNGIYFLDEPEAAFSPKRQLAALVAIKDLVDKGSQFVIATHSPILLAFPNAAIFQFDSSGITPVDYESTEHFLVTYRFMNDYKRQLHYLFT